MEAKDYIWYYWEADLIDIQALEHHGLLPSHLSKEATDITATVQRTGYFDLSLRERALALVTEVRTKFGGSLEEIRRKEQEEYEKEPADLPIDQPISVGFDPDFDDIKE
ncbi:hypothetical protein D5W64_13060 [Salmonella enterica subsp. enterica serovar Saintpaul]|nr:hypothetical protein [Salmonella enterica subsp. enterica serovar Saintpaul]